MAITTRAGKGFPLTHPEMDTNLTDLRDGVSLMVPKTKGKGIKVDSLGTPTFPWLDLHGAIHLNETGPGSPLFAVYQGSVKQIQFDVADELSVNYTFPHDYAPNTDIYIFVDWSHASTLVTGGTVTWGFERMYAKGHNQAAFSAPKLLTFVQAASTIQYRHSNVEMRGFVAGGSPTEFDTAQLESGGTIIGRLYLIANGITVSGGQVPKPYLHRVGVHYQSAGLGTKSRTPDFWT